jgi:hypothetical protein
MSTKQYNPEFATWSELTSTQRSEIFHAHILCLTDYDSCFDFVAYLSDLRWSFDQRPPEERLHRLPDGTPEIPGTWFGYDNDNKLIFEPPAMRRVTAEEYDNREIQTTVATLSIKVSPVIARLLTKLLNKHINNQRKIVANQPKESVISAICMEEVETAEETLNGIDKALRLWETENNIQ